MVTVPGAGPSGDEVRHVADVQWWGERARPDDAAVLRELHRVCGEHLGETAGMDMVAEIGSALSRLSELRSLASLSDYWRARCPVEAADVVEAGVTWSQAMTWAERVGLVPCDPDLDLVEPQDGWAMVRMRRKDGPAECDAVFELVDGDCSRSVAYSCNSLARALGRPAFAILDEMAEVDP